METPAYTNSDARGYTRADSKADSKAKTEAEAQNTTQAKIEVHTETDDINNVQTQIETADSGKQHNTEATPTQETRQRSMSTRRQNQRQKPRQKLARKLQQHASKRDPSSSILLAFIVPNSHAHSVMNRVSLLQCMQQRTKLSHRLKREGSSSIVSSEEPHL